MKWSTRILVTMLIIAVSGLLVSNMVLKNEYRKIDKNDTYWTYGKILEQHFRYIRIEGGNLSNIAFEQSPNCSVRVLHDWQRNRPSPIDASVRNDTLYITFTYIPRDEGEKNWLKWLTVVRIFAPELVSVDGFNTNFSMFRLRQKNIDVSMTGKSKFEIESLIPDFDSVNVTQKDSSEVVFEMSPEYIPSAEAQSNRESFRIRKLNADLEGNTLLDVGRGKIQDLSLRITDTSAIILSGEGLRRICKP
jgi:hypothetical protein